MALTRDEMAARAALELQDAAAQRPEGVAVGGVARAGHRDRVTHVEGGEEERGERARGAGEDLDVVRVHLDEGEVTERLRIDPIGVQQQGLLGDLGAARKPDGAR